MCALYGDRPRARVLAVTLVAAGFASLAAMRARPPAPVREERRLTLGLNGLTLGDERTACTETAEGTTCSSRTRFAFGPGIDLAGEVVRPRAGPPVVRVAGAAPPFLPSAVGPEPLVDGSGRASLTSPFPLEHLAALVGRAGRGRAAAFGAITIAPCAEEPSGGGAPGCHEVDGLTWGAVLVWTDADGRVRGAVVPTPWGPIVATAEDEDHRRPELLARYVRARSESLRRRIGIPADADRDHPLAITGVRLVDPLRGVVPHGAVVVRGGRLAVVGPASEVKVPPGARVIDGGGGSLLPGLWDMHAHVKQPEWGPAYLAAGVTTVRDVGNEPAYVEAVREEARRPAAPYPGLLLAAFVDAAAERPRTAIQANTPEEARRVVRRFAAAGYDQVKVWQNVPPSVLPHLADEAHRLGLTVTGHVPGGMSAFEAIEAGLDGVNHVDALVDAADGDLASPAGRKLLALLLERRVVVDPTLVVVELGNRPLDRPLAAIEPGLLKAPRHVALTWSAFGQPPERADPGPLRRASRLVRDLQAAGVPIVAGSDQGVPGHTLHRELELYVLAGMTPLQALAAATTVPARVTGRADTVARLAVGREADLVLVDGRPDERIGDIRRVRAVIRGGQVFDPAALWRSVGFAP